MWRSGTLLILTTAMLLAGAPAAAQTTPLPPLAPPPLPPPPPLYTGLPELPLIRPEMEPRPEVPGVVRVNAGTRLGVVLDTPLSTRITRTGDTVRFRTSSPLRLTAELFLPPETEITGTVTEAQKPGGFGKRGVLRVRLERIVLPGGAGAPLVARLDSIDADASGRMAADSNRGADLYTLGVWTLQGTLIGAQAGGGRGAGIGAGAGAAIALIILGSRRGPDLYLEPGMPFSVILEGDAELPGEDVYRAQRDYTRAHGALASAGERPGGRYLVGDPVGAPPRDANRPQLKRRPRP